MVSVKKADANQANDMEFEWDAAHAKVRAERKCGELLSQLEKAPGGDRKSTSAPIEIDSKYKQACHRASTNKDQTAIYQKLAAIPEEHFEIAADNPVAIPSTYHIIRPKEAANGVGDSYARKRLKKMGFAGYL